jgi:hypothetical protein
LVPEASKVANEKLKAEIEKEIKKAIFTVPWASELLSVEIRVAIPGERLPSPFLMG